MACLDLLVLVGGDVLEEMKQDRIRSCLISEVEWRDRHRLLGFGIQVLEVGSALGPTVGAEELLHDAGVVAQILSQFLLLFPVEFLSLRLIEMVELELNSKEENTNMCDYFITYAYMIECCLSFIPSYSRNITIFHHICVLYRISSQIMLINFT